MSTSNSARSRPASVGDAAVGGLLHGLAAGLAMAAFLVVAGLFHGQTPVNTLAAFAVDGQPLASGALTGLLGHLATSGVYGLIWGLGWRLIGSCTSVATWLGGLIYGVLLWGIAQPLIHSLGSSLTQIAPWALLGAHLVYGLVLGFLSGRK